MNDLGLQKKLDAFFLERWEGERKVHGLKGGARAYFLSLLTQRRKAALLVIAPSLREAEDLFVERIPFSETRDYVKVVRLNAESYRAVYGSQSARR